MKKIYLLVLFVFGFSAFAQQKGISYQAVIINPKAVAAPGFNGTSIPLANKSICLSFQIVNSANQVEYQESQSIATDAYGMVNVVIGTGTSVTGLVSTLEAVAWNQGNKKLVVGVNTDGVCSNYTEISNQLLNYSPYSLYAQNADIKDGYVTTAKLADGAVTDPKVAMGINPAKVGLGNVDNTSDADKPVSTATQTALNFKANTTDVTTSLALKANTSSLSPVATSGNYNDLTNKPTIPSSFALPVATASVLGGVKVGANLSIDANGVLNAAGGNNVSSVTGVLPIANGGTGSTSVAGVKNTLGLSGYNVSIGSEAGLTNQAVNAVSVGAGAGRTTQGTQSVAVGYVSGSTNQGAYAVSVGTVAGQAGQGANAVAIGFAAGQNNQGANSVAVGSYAGQSQVANSIALNATGAALNPSTTGFYVAPIRNAAASNSLFYDPTTKEITYGSGSSGQTYVDLTSTQRITGAKAFSADLNVYGITVGRGNSGVSYNTVVGLAALNSNTTGNYNNAFGSQALAANLDGYFNSAFGQTALFKNTSGYDNSAYGFNALNGNTTGSNNSAMGSNSLVNSTTGSGNTAIGMTALSANTTGSNNTGVGFQANVATNNLTNATAIGYGAAVTASNTIQLGNTSVTDVKTSGTLTLKDVTYPNTNGTAGQVLTANNNGNATWTTIASGADASTMTGTVAIANGGTGAATATAALTNLGAAPLVSPTFTGTVTAPIYASTPQALTAGATISWNPANGLNASVTLDQNSTLSFTTTPTAGSYGTLVVSQDATGSRTITLPSTANKVLGSTSTTTIALSSAANAKDILNFYYDGTNCYWNIGQGYGTASSSSSTANLATGVTGTLAVGNGGTGATTLTGLIKGNGTGAMTAAIAGTDYQAPITLTTTGTGSPSLVGNTLNIPNSSFTGGSISGRLTITEPSGLPLEIGSTSTWQTVFKLSNTSVSNGWEFGFGGSANTALGVGKFGIYESGGNYRLGISPGGNIQIGTMIDAGYKFDVSGTARVTGAFTTGSVTLPTSHGSNGQVLTTTGSGTLSWSTPVTGVTSASSPLSITSNTISLGTVPVANGGTGTTNGSITGTTALSFAAGGSNQNVSILPSGTGSVGIGTNSPNSSAILDASSTTKGFLPPRMTYAQKIAIASPPQGLMIYCTNCGTNGEPEYFNGVAWVNMAGGTVASVPITLGSTYGGGKVFYILQSGDPGYVAGETHGLIAATSDTQGYRVFGCRGWPSGTSTALGTGAANTTTLLGCSETNFAAKLARAVTDGGYNDWSLPSKDELNKLYLNRNLVGNFIDVNYWSSSESNCCYAWYQKFSDGSQNDDDKNAQKGIRAIRSF